MGGGEAFSVGRSAGDGSKGWIGGVQGSFYVAFLAGDLQSLLRLTELLI